MLEQRDDADSGNFGVWVRSLICVHLRHLWLNPGSKAVAVDEAFVLQTLCSKVDQHRTLKACRLQVMKHLGILQGC